MSEQEARYSMMESLAVTFKKVAVELGFDISMDFQFRSTDPEKSERKIDGDEFKDWGFPFDCAGQVYVGQPDGRYYLITQNTVHSQRSLIAAAPTLVRNGIDLVDSIRRDGRLGRNPAMLNDIIDTIRDMGFVDDLIEGERWETDHCPD